MNGRRAYHPKVLLKILLFAYSKGILSSREIAWCCETNITFMALSCLETPHWTTIASFVTGHHEAIKTLFERVLLICDEQGLLGHDLIAIDGCKLPSDASKQWSGTFKELESKRDKIKTRLAYALEQHQKLDTLGESDRAERQQQTATTLQKAADKIDEFLASELPREGHGKERKEVKSNITDNDSAKMKTSKGVIQGFNGLAAVDSKHQVIVDAQAFGSGPEQHTLKPILKAIRDRYERQGIPVNKDVVITADTGFANEDNMQYLHDEKVNAYVPDNQFRSRDPRYQGRLDKPERQRRGKHKAIIPASEFDIDVIDESCRCPAGNAMQLKRKGKDRHGNQKLYFEGRLSDCRSCSKRKHCMRNPSSADDRAGHGRQVSFITQASPSYTQWMRHRVDSDQGKVFYGHRMHVVEPVFGNMASNKGLDEFTLRGKDKVETQWQLYCLVHNIEKLQNYGQIAA